MTAEPFSVTCSTCGSQLRVRDPGLEGTISTCPRCGSMVEVRRPEPHLDVGAESVDSGAITRDAVEGPGRVPEAAVGSGFSKAPVEPLPAEDAAPAGPPEWQSDRTKRVRHMALVASLSAAGLLFALLVFGWFVHAWQDARGGGNLAEATTPASPEGMATSSDETSGRIDDETGAGGDRVDDTSQPPSKRSRPGDRDRSQVAGEPEARDPGGVQNSEPAAGEDTGAPQKSGSAQEKGPPSPLESPSVPKQQSPQPSGDGDAPTGMTELPPGLKQYTPFLDLSQPPQDPAPRMETPEVGRDLLLDEAADDSIDPMMVANPPAPTDWDRALSRRMALASDGYPLSDFALLLGQLTGIPIQFDWLAFDVAGIDIRGPVKPLRDMATAREQLDVVAAAADATAQREETYLTLTPGEEAFAEAIAELLDLGDFGDGRSSAINVLNTFLGREAASPDAVQPGKTRDEQRLAGIASEALRRMRGVNGKLPEERISRWANPANGLRPWAPLTGGSAGPQWDTAVTIGQLLREVARDNNATCVINWPDARRRRISPQQLVMPHADGDAASTLRATLDPLGLEIREVSPGYWWVGTEATYDRLHVVTWTEPLGETREPFLARLKTALANAGVEDYRIGYDPESDRVLMLLPRFIARQLPAIRAG